MAKQRIKLTTTFKIGVSTSDVTAFSGDEIGIVYHHHYGAKQSIILPVGEIIEYDGGNGYDISHWRLPNRIDRYNRAITFGMNSGGFEWITKYGEII